MFLSHLIEIILTALIEAESTVVVIIGATTNVDLMTDLEEMIKKETINEETISETDKIEDPKAPIHIRVKKSHMAKAAQGRNRHSLRLDIRDKEKAQNRISTNSLKVAILITEDTEQIALGLRICQQSPWDLWLR